jgi:chlorite dismutase
MSDTAAPDVPQTLEGWFVQHALYHVDWGKVRALAPADLARIGGEGERWLQEAATCGKGDTAAYAVIGHKADLMLVHYREDIDALKEVEHSLAHSPLAEVLLPATSFLSVIEVSLNEASAVAAKKLAEQGIKPTTARYAAAFDQEMSVQRKRLETRLRPVIPSARYACFYPMSKRRGEKNNWYALSGDERRALMRGHGKIGHKHHQQVTQVISGAIGLDDWEWGVTLFSDDCLAFKKLVHEMRFDPASALYAEFGPFHVGIRGQPSQIGQWLAGK